MNTYLSYVLFMEHDPLADTWNDYISGVDEAENLRVWGPEPCDVTETDGRR